MASKRRLRRRKCDRQRYTEREARGRAESLTRKTLSLVEAWRCRTCGMWHIGRRPQQKRGNRLSMGDMFNG